MPGLACFNTAPLECVPKLYARPWGGHALRQFGKSFPESWTIGESWELSGLPASPSQVTWEGSGNLLSLDAVWNEFRHHLRSEGDVEGDETFPWLIKFLECREWVSVQVHPDDRTAVQHGMSPRGKFEVWYIVESVPDAELLVGPKHGTTLGQLREAFERAHTDVDEWRDLVDSVPLTSGDFVVVPPGTIHSARGIVALEVQTPADVTYRMYDWGRTGLDGLPRPLHIELACDAVQNRTLQGYAISTDIVRVEQRRPLGALRLLDAPFQIDEYRVGNHEIEIRLHDLSALCVVAGTAELSWQSGRRLVAAGQTVLLPAALGQVTLMSTNGTSRLMCVSYPRGNPLCALTERRETLQI